MVVKTSDHIGICSTCYGLIYGEGFGWNFSHDTSRLIPLNMGESCSKKCATQRVEDYFNKNRFTQEGANEVKDKLLELINEQQGLPEKSLLNRLEDTMSGVNHI